MLINIYDPFMVYSIMNHIKPWNMYNMGEAYEFTLN